MDVSVIIINYNTKGLTEDCIKSVQRHTTKVNYEIILVDNGSSDGSETYFLNYPEIKFIKSEKNIGFGKANNLGYKYSTAKFIFLLNSDTLLLNNAVKLFCDAMEALPIDIACLGCNLIDKDLQPTNSYGDFPTFKSILKTLKSIYLSKIFNGINGNKTNTDIYKVDDLSKSKFVDYIIGADLFIRRDVIEKMKLFDPEFFMYFEESEMQFRYSKNGYKSLIIDGPKIIHLECSLDQGKTIKYKTSQRYLFFEGMFTYLKKRYPFFLYIIGRVLLLGFIPTVFSTNGTFKEKQRLLLMFFGFKIIKR
jgi:GT2 family glycosyltransferase